LEQKIVVDGFDALALRPAVFSRNKIRSLSGQHRIAGLGLQRHPHRHLNRIARLALRRDGHSLAVIEVSPARLNSPSLILVDPQRQSEATDNDSHDATVRQLVMDHRAIQVSVEMSVLGDPLTGLRTRLFAHRDQKFFDAITTLIWGQPSGVELPFKCLLDYRVDHDSLVNNRMYRSRDNPVGFVEHHRRGPVMRSVMPI